jgi:hypothetical protein
MPRGLIPGERVAARITRSARVDASVLGWIPRCRTEGNMAPLLGCLCRVLDDCARGYLVSCVCWARAQRRRNRHHPNLVFHTIRRFSRCRRRVRFPFPSGTSRTRMGILTGYGLLRVPLLLHAQVPNSRHLTPREGGHPIPPVEPAMQTLTRLDRCALEFAARQSSGKIYPESLREFGSAKLGCLPDAVANQGFSDGFHYSYRGTSRNESGQVASYEARARWKSLWLNGVFELYTNQNAVFLWSETGDALTKGSPPVRMAPQFDFGLCLVTFERSTPYGQKQIPVTDELV